MTKNERAQMCLSIYDFSKKEIKKLCLQAISFIHEYQDINPTTKSISLPFCYINFKNKKKIKEVDFSTSIFNLSY
nr:MAG TPA: hypothetical protein [Caudoviricetes sp.]